MRRIPRARKLVGSAVRQGWRVEEFGSGLRLLSPDGKTTVYVHSSPGDSRWEKNLVAQLRRGGYRDRPSQSSRCEL